MKPSGPVPLADYRQQMRHPPHRPEESVSPESRHRRVDHGSQHISLLHLGSRTFTNIGAIRSHQRVVG